MNQINYSKYIHELSRCIKEIDFEIIKKIEDKIVETVKKGGNIYLLGNGGNAATAAHWVVDFSKGIENIESNKVNMYSLSDNIAIVTAYANDISFEDIYYLQLKNKLKEADLLIILSASGNSKNLVKAVKYAKEQNIFCVSIVGDFDGEVTKYSDLKMIINSKNYGIIEDIQLTINHLISQSIKEGKKYE